MMDPNIEAQPNTDGSLIHQLMSPLEPTPTIKQVKVKQMPSNYDAEQTLKYISQIESKTKVNSDDPFNQLKLMAQYHRNVNDLQQIEFKKVKNANNSEQNESQGKLSR